MRVQNSEVVKPGLSFMVRSAFCFGLVTWEYSFLNAMAALSLANMAGTVLTLLTGLTALISDGVGDGFDGGVDGIDAGADKAGFEDGPGVAAEFFRCFFCAAGGVDRAVCIDDKAAFGKEVVIHDAGAVCLGDDLG